MKFFISKNKKLPAVAQKGLLPRKEFMTQGKERFLAAFDASASPRNTAPTHQRRAYITIFFKVGVGALALLCIGVGLSAYADTANVSATNPLYALKRIGENVQLALTSPAEKPQLQATFAVRRANEIAALQASAPTSTLIPALTSQLQQDINVSLSATDVNVSVQSGTPMNTGDNKNYGRVRYGAGTKATSSASSTVTANVTSSSASASTSVSSSVDIGSIDVYCNAFRVSTSGVLIGQLEASLAARPNGFADFNEQCDANVHLQGSGASSSTGATFFIGPNQNHHSRHPMGGGLGVIASGTATTTTATTTPSTTQVSGVTSTATVIVTPKVGL